MSDWLDDHVKQLKSNLVYVSGEFDFLVGAIRCRDEIIEGKEKDIEKLDAIIRMALSYLGSGRIGDADTCLRQGLIRSVNL